MSKVVAVIAVVLVAGALSVAPQSQARVPIPEVLAVRTAAGESLSVIVGVNATFVPEGRLDRAAAVDQRAAVARVTDDVMARAADAGITVGTRLDFLPFFTARVDRATLDRMLAAAGMASTMSVCDPAGLYALHLATPNVAGVHVATNASR